MSFAQPQHPQRRAAMPMAPMIDILFLLIIFFVTTSSFRAEEQHLDVNLPTAESAETAQVRPSEVIVNIREDGTILIGSAEHTLETLHATLSALVAEYPDEHLIIRGDQLTLYERIIAVMDTARAAGIKSLDFAIVRPAEQSNN